MDNHHKEVGKLALAGLEAKAQVDDLLPKHDKAPRELQPTEERVREVVRHLSRPKHAFETNEDFELRLTHARSIEALLAENKALRAARDLNREAMESVDTVLVPINPKTHVAVPREPTAAMIAAGMAENVLRLAPVERGTARFGDAISFAINPNPAYRAMLTAASQEGE